MEMKMVEWLNHTVLAQIDEYGYGVKLKKKCVLKLIKMLQHQNGDGEELLQPFYWINGQKRIQKVPRNVNMKSIT